MGRSCEFNISKSGKNDRGAHMNISGGGVAIHSKNKDNAIMLL